MEDSLFWKSTMPLWRLRAATAARGAVNRRRLLAKTPPPGIEKELWHHGGISACDASPWACVARASLLMASLLRCMEVANEPMPACAAGGRWAFRRRRASICNAFRLLAGLWGLCLGRRPSSQCRAPAFTRQDTPRRIADDKCMEENPHQFPQRCPTLALAPMGALLSRAGHPTFNPMGSIQADVRRVRRRVQREVPSGMR